MIRIQQILNNYRGRNHIPGDILTEDDTVDETWVNFILTINQQDVRVALAERVYRSGCLPIDVYGTVGILRTLLSCPDICYRDELFDFIDELYDHHYTEEREKREIYALMREFYPTRSERMLEAPLYENRADVDTRIQAQIDDRVRAESRYKLNKLRTLYSDQENVHNSDINSSSMASIDKLLKVTQTIVMINNVVPVPYCYTLDNDETFHQRVALHLNTLPRSLIKNVDGSYTDQLTELEDQTEMDKNRDDALMVVDLIMTELDCPPIDQLKKGTCRDIPLYTILIGVWNYLSFHEHSRELKLRLKEELEDGRNKCTTGLASRMINALVGFNDEDIGLVVAEDVMMRTRIIHKVNEMCQAKQLDPYLNEDEFTYELNNLIQTEFPDHGELVRSIYLVD